MTLSTEKSFVVLLKVDSSTEGTLRTGLRCPTEGTNGGLRSSVEGTPEEAL